MQADAQLDDPAPSRSTSLPPEVTALQSPVSCVLSPVPLVSSGLPPGAMMPPVPPSDTEQSPEAVAALDTLTAATSAADAPDDGALPTGARLGRYVVLGRLGAGGMGVVYAAWDPELDRRVAVKLLHRRVGGTDGPARMLREAQALARLQHENVLAVHDVGQIDDRVFVATELVPGGTLAAWLAGHPPFREVLRVFEKAGRGLQAAHAAGLVHRDFKPENVLLGPESRVRVVDFGLARTDTSDERTATGSSSGSLLASPLTQVGAIVGTPAYMAPEQHAGDAVGPAADQFAFAVALWEGLYGERPFAGTTVQAVRAEVLAGRIRPAPRGPVPRRLQGLLARALEVAPERRYPSMEALLAALVRAFSAWHDRACWRKLQHNGMRSDFGWQPSARRYCDVYRAAITAA